MKLNFNRQRKGSVIGIFLVLAVAGAAYAYWTAGGSGTGAADTGETIPLTAVQTSEVTDMGPGVDPQPLSGTFTNPNEGPTWVTSVTASVDSVEKAVGAVGDCTAADYVIADAVMAVGDEVVTGDAWSGATIAFANSETVNQDGCQGATVNIAYAIS